MSYELNACNGSMLADEFYFEAFDSVAEDMNDDLNFDNVYKL